MDKHIYAIVNAKILTAKDNGKPLKGKDQSKLYEYKHMLVENGKITKLTNTLEDLPKCQMIDCKGALVTPGLIDPHTHLIHGGSREGEIPLKLSGASYMEIHKAGGGIESTVNDTRNASYNELMEKALSDLKHIASLGVTTIEAKSGYGLNFEDEKKCLVIAKKLNLENAVDIVSTFMGAHSIPREYRDCPEEYVDFICNEMIPYVAENKLAKFCDVFCEKGVFNIEQSERILKTAKKNGLQTKIHADEIVSLGGAELAAKLKVTSADHLMAVSNKGIKELSKTDVIAVLLPGTSFYLKKNYAPARKLINENVAVALATDFNPGSSPSENMQFIMNLGYLYLRMNPEEILNASTLNAAYALDVQKSTGSLDVGKNADFVIWGSENLEYIIYRYGKNHVSKVYKNGRLIFEVSY